LNFSGFNQDLSRKASTLVASLRWRGLLRFNV